MLKGIEISQAMAEGVKFTVTMRTTKPPLSCVTNTTQYHPDGGDTIIPVDPTTLPAIVKDARDFVMNELIITNKKISSFVPDPVSVGCPLAEIVALNPETHGGQLYWDMIYGGFDIRLVHDAGQDSVDVRIIDRQDGVQGGSFTFQPE